MNGQSGKAALLSLSSIPLIMTLGNSMLIPVLPVIRRELSITPLQTSLLITVYSVMAILLIPLAGYLSDRIGRKKVIVPSLIIAGAGGGLSAAASILMDNPYGMLLAGRILQGIGAAGAAPIVMPLVGDLFDSEKEVSSGLGLIETSNTFGKVLSPILGSLIAWISWYAPFVSIPVFCAVSIVLVAVFVKAPNKKEQPVPFRRFVSELRRLFRKEGRWLYVLFAVGGTAMFILFSFLVWFSDKLEDFYKIKGIWKGFTLAVPLAALCTASFLTGKIIGESKKRMKLLATCGFMLAAASMTANVIADGLVMRLALLSVAGIGIGTALPCLDALITEGIDKNERGTVTSLYNSLRFAGVAAGPPVASLLSGKGNGVMFWTLAGAGLLSGLLTWLFIKPNEEGEKSGSRIVPKGRKVLQ
ncbi:MFS transporter [Paenibacillus thailandensis]|uniref:MFS transporter n=1 Tax=Paenibacillus thailandensis TaxID=393250 RepID=A0ABW5QX82_9BACL